MTRARPRGRRRGWTGTRGGEGGDGNAPALLGNEEEVVSESDDGMGKDDESKRERLQLAWHLRTGRRTSIANEYVYDSRSGHAPSDIYS